MVISARDAASGESDAVGNRPRASRAVILLRRAPRETRQRRCARECRKAGGLRALLRTVALPGHTRDRTRHYVAQILDLGCGTGRQARRGRSRAAAARSTASTVIHGLCGSELDLPTASPDMPRGHHARPFAAAGDTASWLRAPGRGAPASRGPHTGGARPRHRADCQASRPEWADTLAVAVRDCRERQRQLAPPASIRGS